MRAHLSLVGDLGFEKGGPVTKVTEVLGPDRLRVGGEHGTFFMRVHFEAPPHLADVGTLDNAKIVLDKFHLSLHLNLAVDLTRRSESRSRDELKGLRFELLRSDLPPERQAVIERLRQSSIRTAEVWRFKEGFRLMYQCLNRQEAELYLDAWLTEALREPAGRLNRVAITFRLYKDKILNYFDHRLTNARAERFNGKIQQLRVEAKGFKSFQNFRTAVLFFFGNLDLYPRKCV